MPKKTTQEEFVQRAKLVHNNRFDYSKAIYAGVHVKVLITCSVHGDFLQKANDHLAGRGCSKCSTLRAAKDRTKTTEEFIEEARAKHGDKYDYSCVEYLTSSHQVKIVCPTHGEFSQIAHQHLAGACCPLCSRGTSSINRRRSNGEFIDQCRIIHKNKYDYSKTIYARGIDEVVIICPIHGEFKQRASSHQNGNGCRRCSNTHPLTTETFIEKARLIHGDQYDYSQSKYLSAQELVKIICREHGEFDQQACSHLNGRGCKICGFNKTR